MNDATRFPSAIQAALAGPEPGRWMPPLPPGCIRLSAGYPAPALVPVDALSRAVQQLLARERDLPLHYLGSPRMEDLRAWIRARMAARGMPVATDELLVTAGSCQAIDLVARTLLDSDREVWVEAPTYMEALEMFGNYTRRILSIPVDEDGLDVDELARRLEVRSARGGPMPALIYLIPTFQNPTGTALSVDRRRALVNLARRYDLLLVEDDAYGELWFDQPLPTLRSLAPERVAYLGSLSKVVAPGLRVGWLAGPAWLVRACGWFKKDLDHPFAEAVAAEYLSSLDFDEHLNVLRRVYKRRRDLLVQALAAHLPDCARWHLPRGGYFVWIRLPGVDTAALLPEALQQGVAYVPGCHFFVDPAQGRHHLRLSFSYVAEPDLDEGVRRLAAALAKSRRDPPLMPTSLF
jgi:2-aminoadipate transaminase